MILILMGVAGSGKTTVGRLLSQRLGWEFIDADDFHPPGNVAKMSHGEPLTDEDRIPWLDALRSAIDERLALGLDAVVACSALKAAYRHRLKRRTAFIRFIYLKGAYETFHPRLASRAEHFMPPDLLRSQFETLEEPQEAIAIDASRTPEAIVRSILETLGLEAGGSNP